MPLRVQAAETPMRKKGHGNLGLLPVRVTVRHLETLLPTTPLS